MSDKPIGIFDSGIGGLTVLKEVQRILPGENIVYLGDTARVPYGIRSPETVTKYSFECTEFLMKKDIKLLVVACNTASAVSLAEMRKIVPIPVIGVIAPGAAAAVNSTKRKKIGIIGTEATIKSNAYVDAIKSISGITEVYGLPCPLFVPLVEEGWTEGEIARLVAERYFKNLIDKDIDTLVLGCTHYPLLKGIIQDIMKGVILIDSAVETAKVVREKLSGAGEIVSGGSGRTCKFYVTDSPEKFIAVGERFLKRKVEDIEKIAL